MKGEVKKQQQQQQRQRRSWCRWGIEKGGLQQSRSTHSGAGEKETLNMNVVGKRKL